VVEFPGESFWDGIGGNGLSGAGDVDGDGYGDVLLGADRQDAGGRDAGPACLVYGPVAPHGSVGPLHEPLPPTVTRNQTQPENRRLTRSARAPRNRTEGGPIPGRRTVLPAGFKRNFVGPSDSGCTGSTVPEIISSRL
jgi:hypothetical protein